MAEFKNDFPWEHSRLDRVGAWFAVQSVAIVGICWNKVPINIIFATCGAAVRRMNYPLSTALAWPRGIRECLGLGATRAMQISSICHSSHRSHFSLWQFSPLAAEWSRRHQASVATMCCGRQLHIASLCFPADQPTSVSMAIPPKSKKTRCLFILALHGMNSVESHFSGHSVHQCALQTCSEQQACRVGAASPQELARRNGQQKVRMISDDLLQLEDHITLPVTASPGGYYGVTNAWKSLARVSLKFIETMPGRFDAC